jgi:5'-deoxynucleotidase YfbR-like HD superfamily hydrolase
MSVEAMNDVLSLCHVPRWSIVPVLRPQSVGEHSYRTTIILLEMASMLGFSIDVRALCWALIHDGIESRTGDVPAGCDATPLESGVCDWWHRSKATVPDRIRDLVKVADYIEAAAYVAMYGVGPHAAGVAWEARERVLAKAQEVGEYCGEPRLLEVARDLLDAVISERGRFVPMPRDQFGTRAPEQMSGNHPAKEGKQGLAV